MVRSLAIVYRDSARVDADRYCNCLRDFILCACEMADIPVPPDDKILELIPESLKVQRGTP